jgi:hypothetical protein
VEARYVRLGRNRVGFQLAGYDSGRALVIDPALIFSTYFGESGAAWGKSVALDASGNIYLTGQTTASQPPGTLIGPALSGGGQAVFLARISSSGTLLSTTFIGGADDAQASGAGVTVDSNGNIYIAGETSSYSFPALNAIQANYGGGSFSAFVLELNNAANALIFSTFLGGTTADYAVGVNVDSAGNIYVAGTTGDTNFPVYNAFQSTLPDVGVGSGFATKLAPGGGSFIYSTYFGGSNGGEYVNGSTIDSNGNFYIYGDTNATDLPVMNAFQPTFCGVTQGQTVTNNHGYVAKFSPTGTEVYATYICGSIDPDAVRGAAADQYGDLFITGNTSSPTFPLLNPIQAQYGGGAGNSFVMELSPSGGLLYSTYLGGSGDDVAYGLSLDPWETFTSTESLLPLISPS